MLEQIQVRREQLSRRAAEAEEEAASQEKQQNGYLEELERISGEIRTLAAESREYEEKIEAIQKDLAGRTEKFRIGQTAYHREQSRLESLKNITERYDGYGNSIRKVMDHKGQEQAFLA